MSDKKRKTIFKTNIAKQDKNLFKLSTLEAAISNMRSTACTKAKQASLKLKTQT